MNMELFLESLKVMGKGMLGIFIITAVIILVMVLITRIGRKDEPKDKNDES